MRELFCPVEMFCVLIVVVFTWGRMFVKDLFTCMLKMGPFYFASNFEKKFKSTIISSVGGKTGPTAGEGIHWYNRSGKSFGNSFKH